MQCKKYLKCKYHYFCHHAIKNSEAADTLVREVSVGSIDSPMMLASILAALGSYVVVDTVVKKCGKRFFKLKK